MVGGTGWSEHLASWQTGSRVEPQQKWVKERHNAHRCVPVTSSGRLHLPQFHFFPIVYLNIDPINQRTHWLDQSPEELVVFGNTLMNTQRYALPISSLNPNKLTAKISHQGAPTPATTVVVWTEMTPLGGVALWQWAWPCWRRSQMAKLCPVW